MGTGDSLEDGEDPESKVDKETIHLASCDCFTLSDSH